MPSVPIDINDLSKGFYWVSDSDYEPKSKPLTEATRIWICFQLYIGQTPKQIQRKLKVQLLKSQTKQSPEGTEGHSPERSEGHTIQQIKNVPNSMYKKPGFYEATGSTYSQWWCGFIPDTGASELYYLRLMDLERMIKDLSINPHEKYETKDEYEYEYESDLKRLKESLSLLIDSFNLDPVRAEGLSSFVEE